MRRATTLGTLALAIAAGALAGCPDPRKMALEELQAQGYEAVELSDREGSSSSFAVKATKDGRPCSGDITVMAMPGSTTADYAVEVTCKAPQDAAPAPAADPLAADDAACTGGDAAACLRLGAALYEGPVDRRDLPRAREVLAKACDAGTLEACTHLGFLCMRGLGGPQEDQRAHDLWTRACDGGHMDGCAHLGRWHYINQENKEALPLLEKACGGGSLLGCNALGEWLERRNKGEDDLKRARELFEAACDGGAMEGCANLGAAYLTGRGAPQNAARARELLDRACKAEIAVACEQLRKLE